MLQCYMDESESENVLTIGGYVASVENWRAFNKDWAEALDVVNIGRPLHMSEYMGIWSEDTKAVRIGHLYDIIDRYALFGVGVAVDKKALARIMAPVSQKAFKKPWIFALLKAVTQTLNRGHVHFAEQPVQFIFDRGREEKMIKNIWPELVANAPEKAQVYLPKEPQFADDEEALPLQAADMKAWFARKAYEHQFLGAEALPSYRFGKNKVLAMTDVYREHQLIAVRKQIHLPSLDPSRYPLGFPKVRRSAQ